MQSDSKSNTTRQCCVCNKALYGRSDKVFCDIHCKNHYHSDVRKHTRQASAVNIKILKKNYITLCMLLGDKCERYVIKKLALEEMGFTFDVISGIEKTPYGLKMNVFELSWYYSSNNNIVVMQDKEQTKISPFMYKRWQGKYKPGLKDIPVKLTV